MRFNKEKSFIINSIFFKTETIMAQEVASKVKEIIVDLLGADEAKVTETASFTTDLGADSLETVDLIMKLEQEFDIEIPEDKANSIQTVGDAIAYVESAVANK